jgi:hypothetical protein
LACENDALTMILLNRAAPAHLPKPEAASRAGPESKQPIIADAPRIRAKA